MKALVIKDGLDIDIILEDGSYAFSWVVDGIRKTDCYQTRIENKLEDGDSLDELLEGSKCYYLNELESDTTISFVMKQAIDWLTTNSCENVEAVIVTKTDEDSIEDLINQFLKLK